MVFQYSTNSIDGIDFNLDFELNSSLNHFHHHLLHLTSNDDETNNVSDSSFRNHMINNSEFTTTLTQTPNININTNTNTNIDINHNPIEFTGFYNFDFEKLEHIFKNFNPNNNEPIINKRDFNEFNGSNEDNLHTEKDVNKFDMNTGSNVSLSTKSSNSTSILLTNPNSPEYIFHPPQFDLSNIIPKLVKLAHRNKDIKLSDMNDKGKVNEFYQKILKKVKRKSVNNINKTHRLMRTLSDSGTFDKKKRTIGRPLTPKTKVRLTLVPNLPTLYSMLVTENIELDLNNINNNMGHHLRQKFKILKRGDLSDSYAYQELLFNEAVDWRFKTNNTNTMGLRMAPYDSNDLTSGGSFPGKSQTVTFLDTEDIADDKVFDDHSKNFDTDGTPTYKSIDLAVRELFHIEEYTFLRITRAAAFEKTGAIVLKMETAKPGDKWLDDDEFDLKLMFKLVSSNESQNWDDDLIGKPGDEITPTFLKKKIARPRYKSNMRIYLIPRDTDVVLYTKESMLKRDIVNGTLDLNDTNDRRMIITAFDFEKALRELKII